MSIDMRDHEKTIRDAVIAAFPDAAPSTDMDRNFGVAAEFDADRLPMVDEAAKQVVEVMRRKFRREGGQPRLTRAPDVTMLRKADGVISLVVNVYWVAS